MGAADSPFWQARADALGEIVNGILDLDQAIRTIVRTPLGSVPLEPEFGCALLDCIDLPATKAAPAIVRAVARALARWEPRIVLGPVEAQFFGQERHALRLTVSWKPSAMGQDAYTKTVVSWA